MRPSYQTRLRCLAEANKKLDRPVKVERLTVPEGAVPGKVPYSREDLGEMSFRKFLSLRRRDSKPNVFFNSTFT